MQYAKVKSDTVIKFPYTTETLMEENPYTQYDDRFDLLGWYEQTDDAINDGNMLVLVEALPIPEFDAATKKIKEASTPTLVDNKWVLGWDILDKTQEEIQQYQTTIASD